MAGYLLLAGRATGKPPLNPVPPPLPPVFAQALPHDYELLAHLAFGSLRGGTGRSIAEAGVQIALDQRFRRATRFGCGRIFRA